MAPVNPFVCMICDARFPTYKPLMDHRKIHLISDHVMATPQLITEETSDEQTVPQEPSQQKNCNGPSIPPDMLVSVDGLWKGVEIEFGFPLLTVSMSNRRSKGSSTWKRMFAMDDAKIKGDGRDAVKGSSSRETENPGDAGRVSSVPVAKDTVDYMVGRRRNSLSCPQCKKSYSTKSSMTRHMECHLKVVYTCEHCLKSMTRKDTLVRHQKQYCPR